MPTRTTVTKRDAEKVLAAVRKQCASWLTDNCQPTLMQDWDFLGHGHAAPWSIVWEEGPDAWAIMFPHGGIEEGFGFTLSDVSADVPDHVFGEAITGWALGIYVA